MVKILATSREILCFSRQGLGREVLGDNMKVEVSNVFKCI